MSPKIPHKMDFSVEAREKIRALTDKAKAESWSNVNTLLEIRTWSNTPTQNQYQYEGDLLDYFYPISRTRQQVLLDAITKHRQGKR